MVTCHGIPALAAHQADGIRTCGFIICFGLSLEESENCLSFATSGLVASSGFTYKVILGSGHKTGAPHRVLLQMTMLRHTGAEHWLHPNVLQGRT